MIGNDADDNDNNDDDDADDDDVADDDEADYSTKPRTTELSKLHENCNLLAIDCTLH